jgi:hypothetical protein
LLSKLRPRFVKIWNGQPNRAKKWLTAADAVTSAVCEGSGTHSTYLMNWSTMTKTYSLPSRVLESGPRKFR